VALGSSGMRVVRIRFTNFAQIGLSRITSALTAWGSWGGGGSNGKLEYAVGGKKFNIWAEFYVSLAIL